MQQKSRKITSDGLAGVEWLRERGSECAPGSVTPARVASASCQDSRGQSDRRSLGSQRGECLAAEDSWGLLQDKLGVTDDYPVLG